MEITKVGVIGAGQMGNGIAHVMALAGYDVVLSDVSAEALERAKGMVGMAEGVLDRLEAPSAPGGSVSYHDDLAAALEGRDMVLEAIPEPKARATKTRPPLALSDLQPVRRDFAFLLDRSIAAATVMRAAQGADKKLIAGVSVFDVFESEAIGADRRSLAIEVVLQPTEKTLTDEEIDATSAKIVAAVEKATGGTLRT